MRSIGPIDRERPAGVGADHRHRAEPAQRDLTLEQARERCQIVREAAHAAGREPLRFSMMTTCVVGRDEGEVRDRLRAWDESSKLDHAPELAGTVEQVAQTLREYEAVGVERAMQRTPITMDDYFNSRMIVDPFHMLDICLETDGACAVLVTSANALLALGHPAAAASSPRRLSRSSSA